MTTPMARYVRLSSKKGSVLARMRRCAELTVPSMCPPEGHTENTQLKSPWQSHGARITSRLASKLVLTLMPPNTPFYQFSLSPEMEAKLAAMSEGQQAEGQANPLTAVNIALSNNEQVILSRLEKRNYRVPLGRALVCCIVTGDVLFEFLDGNLRWFRPDQFVVRRTGAGALVEAIIKEPIVYEEIPENLQHHFTDDDSKAAHIYTRYWKDGKIWRTAQSINEYPVDGSEGTYSSDDTVPVFGVPYSLMTGENNGRGLVEENIGDLISYEALSKSFTESAAIMAQIKFLVNPNGSTKISDLNSTPNGGYCPGTLKDVEVLNVQHFNEVRVAGEKLWDLKKSLSAAFLDTGSIQREGERVTAEEIRLMAEELEAGLGGFYSQLALSLITPFLKRVIRFLEQSKEILAMPDFVELKITTGFEALGRGHDLQKLKGFAQDVTELGEEGLSWVDMGDLVSRLAASRGLDQRGLVKTKQTKQAENQQNQQAAMMQAATPAVAREATKGMMGVSQ